MTNINRINFGVNQNQFFKQEEKEDLTKGTKKEPQSTEVKKQLESSEVLGFMAAQNADIIPVKTQKTLDISKYVSKEQEARIADFVKGFEADYENVYAAAKGEFSDLSDKAANDLAIAYINSTYKV